MAINNEKAKNFLLSKTVWGVIAMAFAIFSGSLGLKLEGAVDDIVGFIGMVLALFGRFTVKQPITIMPTPTEPSV